jgi:predicted nucleic-acid-binding protein
MISLDTNVLVRLSRSYQFERAEIVDTLSQLVKAKGLVFASSDMVSRAIRAYETGKGDFADYLIREEGRVSGFPEIATFDRALLKESHFFSP